MKIFYYPTGEQRSVKTIATAPEETPFSASSSAQRYAATIGFFDGVHLGHCHVIEQLKEEARQHGLLPMVITFERHPRQVLQPEWQPQLLTTLEEKISLLAATGIDTLVVLRFDKAMSLLSSQQFMQQVLKRDLCVDLLLTGYDNRFGHDRTATFKDYVAYGQALQMEVVCGSPKEVDGLRVSSSLVRQLVGEGNLSEVAHCLGRYYRLSGKVVHGQQIGRQLGFPTANIVPDEPCRLLPAPGVYAVSIETDHSIDGRSHFAGMMNIGTRPTFDGHQQTIEVHLFDFDGTLYDHRLTVAFVERLRSEQHFDSPEALVSQMQADALRARQLLSSQDALRTRQLLSSEDALRTRQLLASEDSFTSN